MVINVSILVPQVHRYLALYKSQFGKFPALSWKRLQDFHKHSGDILQAQQNMRDADDKNVLENDDKNVLADDKNVSENDKNVLENDKTVRENEEKLVQDLIKDLAKKYKNDRRIIPAFDNETDDIGSYLVKLETSLLNEYLLLAKDMCEEVWATFDVPEMLGGIFSMVFAICNAVAIVLSLDKNEETFAYFIRGNVIFSSLLVGGFWLKYQFFASLPVMNLVPVLIAGAGKLNT